MQIGLDIGTSSVTGVVTGADRVVRAQAQAPLQTAAPHPYWSEQFPDDWWQACCTVLRALLRAVPGVSITGIGLSGQMHGLVVLDRAGGVLRPAMLWNDGRAHHQAQALTKAVPDSAMLSGVPVMPGFAAPKLAWVRDHEPDVFDQIAHVLLPKDYIGHRLHGGFATDGSDAAGSGWLDQRSRQWASQILAATGADPAWMPDVVDGTTCVGQVTAGAAAQTGLPVGVPVFAGAGDAAAGAVAVGAVEDGAGFVSLGTSGQLFVARDCYAPQPKAMIHAYAHSVPQRWFQMAAMLNGARPMAWFAGVAQAPIATLLDEAAKADPARAPLFLPYLTGERSPHGDPHIRAGFVGLEDASDRGAMMRAVVEAIAFCFADARDSLGPDVLDDTPLPALGGGAQSDMVLQGIADALGRSVARPAQAAFGPAMGAALLAAVGAGDLARTDLSVRPKADWVFHPDPRPDHAARLGQWRALYQALKPLSRPNQPALLSGGAK
ncbi:MAG: xylulokinase [Primorskyibacter sp.]